jgi:RES domain-containing protein
MADDLGRLQAALYFGLEPARQAHGPALLDALRAGAGGPFNFDGWSRIVDYRYSLAPWSTAGSVKGEGGRFNVGRRLSPGAFTSFPALYLAEDYATAHCERFGQAPEATTGGLTSAELALRHPNSFTHVRVRGRIDMVLDVGDPAALKPFVDVIRSFQLPSTVPSLTRRLALRRAPWLVRSAVALQRQLLHRHRRMMPMQYDLPANCQVFGRLASAAGLHAIRYPSARHEARQCLALFPQNWGGSACFIEVADTVPPAARLVRLDATTGATE